MALIAAIAYDVERNLGGAYNQTFDRLRSDDWACFLDHDAMWTTREWYKQLREGIARNHDAGIFTACTNRIGRKSQIAPGAPSGHDILQHFAFGESLRARHGSSVRDITNDSPISGVVMCLSRATWERMGKFKDGFFGVDNRAHRDVRAAGLRVYLMPGLYVYHFYRADGRGHENAPRAK